MTSNALAEWSGTRRRKLQLQQDIRKTAQLPWQEKQADGVMVVRLAAEFQGFARDLHDEAIEFMVTTVAGSNSDLLSALRVGMAANRTLGRNNANADTLEKDFYRLGMLFWGAINRAYPRRGHNWRQQLNKLVEMRNCLAHEDVAKQLKLQSEGYSLTESRVKDWQRDLDLLAEAMDDVVGAYLSRLLRVPRPW